MGAYVDTLKFAGGSFVLMPRRAVAELIELCHAHEVLVSTGGFLEYVLTQGPTAVDRYLEEARELGFDIIEISSGFVTLLADDLVALTERVLEAELRPKPEVGIQFGAGGASTIEALEAEGVRDVSQAIELAKRHLDAGAELVMIESEGITEQAREWRTDAVARIATELDSNESCSRRPSRRLRLVREDLRPRGQPCSSTTARSSSSNACAPASGAPRTPGAASSAPSSDSERSHLPVLAGVSGWRSGASSRQEAFQKASS